MNEFNDRKVIRNRQVVREVDTSSTLELRWYLLIGVLFAGLICVYNWQQYRFVEYGYRIEVLRKETAQLEEARKKLFLEQAMLRSPARIDQLAREQLGLAAPQAHQIIFDRVPATDAAAGTAELAWDTQRNKRTLDQ